MHTVQIYIYTHTHTYIQDDQYIEEMDEEVKILEIADPTKQVIHLSCDNHVTVIILIYRNLLYRRLYLIQWKENKHGQPKRNWKRQKVNIYNILKIRSRIYTHLIYVHGIY